MPVPMALMVKAPEIHNIVGLEGRKRRANFFYNRHVGSRLDLLPAILKVLAETPSEHTACAL